MATVTGLTKERMLTMEAETVTSGLVDINGNLILYTRAGLPIDAGSVIGPRGADSTYNVGPFTGGTAYYSRLATLNGESITAGASFEFLLSGLGGYGTAKRATILIHIAQRGSNVITARTWGWGLEDSTLPLKLYTRQISEFVFEVWGLFAPYTHQATLTLLASYGSTVAIDSASTTAPTNLVEYAIDRADSWNSLKDKPGLATETTPGLVELADYTETLAGTNNSLAVTPLTVFQTRGEWEGTVSPSWTFGKPDVVLSDGSTKSAYLPANDIDVQPGATVILNRTPGDTWTIIAVKNSGPAFLKQIKLDPYSSSWAWYDSVPGNANFISSNAEPGPTINGAFGPAYVTKSSTGWVVASGLFRVQIDVVAGSYITRLPVGFRPAIVRRFGNPFTTGGYVVYPDGMVVCTTALATGSIISLGNMKFNDTANRTALTGYANGWTDYGNLDYGVACSGVDSLGWGFTDGFVKGGTLTNNTNIASLPASSATATNATRHQPSAAVGSAGGGFYITSTTIQYNTINGGNTGLSLSGGFWDPQSLAIPWLAPNLLNGWVNYGTASFPAVGIYKRSDGLVAMRGFIKTGPIGTFVCTLPPKFRPKHRIIFTTLTSPNAVGRVDIYQGGGVFITSGSSDWFSLEGILFAPDH